MRSCSNWRRSLGLDDPPSVSLHLCPPWFEATGPSSSIWPWICPAVFSWHPYQFCPVSSSLEGLWSNSTRPVHTACPLGASTRNFMVISLGVVPFFSCVTKSLLLISPSLSHPLWNGLIIILTSEGSEVWMRKYTIVFAWYLACCKLAGCYFIFFMNTTALVFLFLFCSWWGVCKCLWHSRCLTKGYMVMSFLLAVMKTGQGTPKLCFHADGSTKAAWPGSGLPESTLRKLEGGQCAQPRVGGSKGLRQGDALLRTQEITQTE